MGLMCGNQAHLSWAPSTFYQKGPEPPQQVQAPPGTREAPLGSRLGCVCVRSVCIFSVFASIYQVFHRTCFFFSFFLFLKTKCK